MAGRRRKGKRLGLLVLVILLALVIAGCYILWQRGYIDLPFGTESASDGSDSTASDSSDSTASDGSDSTVSDSSDSSGGADIVTENLSIHFPMLGNAYTGDCVLIKTGDTEVLIDAGSRQSSAAAISDYIDEYCTDGVLEYVIATHADRDHIAGLVGTKSGGSYNGILYEYRVGTLIQFVRTNKSAQTDSGGVSLYGNYLEAVSYAVAQGTQVYTALDCWNNADGAQRSYTLSEGIEMNFLYQRFYEEYSGDENNYSVCMLLTQGQNNYLFTGDLEAEGEESLVEENDLPECKLFKAGHHGSPTSSNDVLLSVIRPEIVVVCCCCGSDEYTDNVANMFPSQAFVDRVAKYTDRIYVTTVVSENDAGFEPMNGNIVLSSDGGEVSVRCSASDLVFRESEWFKENRTWPSAG